MLRIEKPLPEAEVYGRGDGIRTHDLVDPNDARYQLRYAPTYL